MRSMWKMGVALAALQAGVMGANAADIIEPPPYVPPPPVYVEAEGGFYIRGDAGYAFKSKSSGDYAFWNWGHDGVPNPDGSYNYGSGTIDRGIDHVVAYDEIKLRGAASFGVGLGYRLNKFVRGDLTLDYMKHDVSGSSDCGPFVESSFHISPVIGGCKFKDSADAAIWTAMANAYVDIFTVGSVTPYLGAGAGFAHVKYGDMKNEIFCGSQPGCHGLPSPAYVGYHKGESSWRFAASLMAGASVDITKNLKFDAGYKYTRIDGGDAWGYIPYDKDHGATGAEARDHGFDIHTVRAGLRYEFGGGGLGFGKHPVDPHPVPEIAYEEPTYIEPIVYK